jgi:hypothetical protein
MAETVICSLRKVRSMSIEAADLLRSPRPAPLDRCAAVLKAAAHELAGCPAALGRAGDSAEALAEARGIQAVLRRARHLLESAAAFHRQWNGILGAMVGGYTSRGEAAPVTRPRLRSFEG